jgi:hypothetical protein
MGSRKHLVLPIVLSVLVLVFLSACDTGTSNNGSTTGNSPTAPAATTSAATPTSTAPAQTGHNKVGDQVKVGNTWVVTVNSVKTSQGGSFSQPKAGNIYLVVDVTVKNVSNAQQPVSSLLSFTLKDSTGQKYDESIAPDVGTPPDGEVAAGAQLKGQLVYEVPTSQKQFTLTFIGDLLGTDQTIWDLSV